MSHERYRGNRRLRQQQVPYAHKEEHVRPTHFVGQPPHDWRKDNSGKVFLFSSFIFSVMLFIFFTKIPPCTTLNGGQETFSAAKTFSPARNGRQKHFLRKEEAGKTRFPLYKYLWQMATERCDAVRKMHSKTFLITKLIIKNFSRFIPRYF